MGEAMNEPRYSGPNRSGVCKCGHSWRTHHLGVIVREDYWAGLTLEELKIAEAYIPQECEFYGFNETGGLKPDITFTGDRRWIDHCHSYVDAMEENTP